MAVIYCATNKINGHKYIGFDVKWPYRKSAHKSAAKHKSKLVFHNAIRSYGWENFEWEVLEQSDDKEYLLNERERFYIEKYNTFYLNEQGYNMTMGGEATLGHVMSEETKRKISEKKKGKPSWNKGLASPWVTKRNLESKGSISMNRRKHYLVIDPTGKRYEVHGIKEFCKEHNLHPGNMVSVAKGKLNHYKKWLCQLIEE